MSKKVTLREALGFAWKKTKENFPFLSLVMVIMLLLNGGQAVFNKMGEKDPLSFIVALCISIIEMVAWLGVIKISLKLIDGEKPELNDVFSQYNIIFKFIIASFLFSIITMGLPLLIALGGVLLKEIPYALPFMLVVALILMLRAMLKYIFYEFLLVDKGYSPVGSLKKSAEIVKGSLLTIAFYFAFVFVFNIFGFLLFILGLFVTAPVSLLAGAYIYRKISA